jgi:succinate-semialdehyde dehydrogenase/glutarate-semialdehyde dehydrogenase
MVKLSISVMIIHMLLVSRESVKLVRCLSTESSAPSISPSLSSRLRNSKLLRTLVDSTSHDQHEPQSHFQVRDPADPRSEIARVRAMDRDDARRAIERSHAALPSWRDKTTAAYRSNLLLQWSRLIQDNMDDIATIMTLESGKPVAESKGEIGYGVSFLDYYAAEAIRPSSAGGGFVIPTPFSHSDGAPRGQILALQQAVGVCALIAPWNFPIAMVRPSYLWRRCAFDRALRSTRPGQLGVFTGPICLKQHRLSGLGPRSLL